MLPTAGLSFVEAKGFKGVSRNNGDRLSSTLVMAQGHLELSKDASEEVAIKEERGYGLNWRLENM